MGIKVNFCVYCEDILTSQQTGAHSIFKFAGCYNIPNKEEPYSFCVAFSHFGFKYDVSHALTWEFINPDGNIIKKCDSPMIFQVIKQNEPPVAWGVIRINDVLFNKEGEYITRFYVDGEKLNDAPIYVYINRSDYTS